MYTSNNKGVAWIDNEYYDIPTKPLWLEKGISNISFSSWLWQLNTLVPFYFYFNFNPSMEK